MPSRVFPWRLLLLCLGCPYCLYGCVALFALASGFGSDISATAFFVGGVFSTFFFFFFLLSLVAGVSGFSLIMCYVRTCDQKPLLKYENINNTGIYVRVYILYAPNDSHVLCLARIMPGCYARQDTFKSTYLWCAATGIHKSVTRSSCRHKSTNHSTNRSSNQSVEQPFSH